MQIDNLSKWQEHGGSYEVWYLKFNFPQNAALWIRFTLWSAKNSSDTEAAVWAMYFSKSQALSSNGAGIKKTAIKQTFPISSVKFPVDGVIQIQDCSFTTGHTRGSIANEENQISWDLTFQPNDYTFFHVPQTLQKLRFAKSTVCKPNMNIALSGTVSINNQTIPINGAPGCQGHIWGTKYVDQWAWAHCNSFEGSNGSVLEVLTAKTRLGPVPLPQLSALYFEHEGKRYEFNRLKDALCIESTFDLTQWQFKASNQDIQIHGRIQCNTSDLIGVTYKDPTNKLKYCYNTEFASMEVLVYEKKQLKCKLTSNQTTAFETVSSTVSESVKLLL